MFPDLTAWQKRLPALSEGRVPRAPNQKSPQRSWGVVELRPPKHVKNPRPCSTPPASFIAATIWHECDELPHPTLSPRRGLSRAPFSGNTNVGIGRKVSRITESMIGKILSPGERTQVRASVKNTNSESFFKRSHKVIVALTVQEILDEHIAKKLANRRIVNCSTLTRPRVAHRLLSQSQIF